MKILAAFSVLAMHIVPAPALIAAERTGTHSAFSLIAQSVEGWEIRYAPRPRAMTPVEINGERYFRFTDPGTMHEQEDATGKPSLPADALTLGIPFGSHITARQARLIRHCRSLSK